MFASRCAALLLPIALHAGCGDDSVGSGSDSATSGASTGESSGDTSEGSSGSTGDSGTGTDSGSGGETSGGETSGAEVTCSSNTYWTMGDHESPLMHPGGACLTCHDMAQPGEDIIGRLAIAGTVYPTLHEPDDCNGVVADDGPVTVEITTADDVVITLAVNSAGNFLYDLEENPAITFPIKAKVKRGDQELAMVSAQSTGDCNSCHTEQGTSGAPGRILAP
ncbi:MAG: hypothetical protein R3A79_27595 [Nannocystaceae bacterium]